MKIYYARISRLSEADMQKAMELLPSERIDRIRSIRQKKTKEQSIAAGLLLEYALAERGLSGKNLTFQKNADGKPSIKEELEFCYNLSHSGDFVALAVDDVPIGVDVEGLRGGYQKLAERFFSKEEVAVLKDCWSDEVFTKLWTRKESYLKATGFGMRMPLDGFSVLEEQVKINEKMPEEMLHLGENYFLVSFWLKEGCWLSVCRKGKRFLEEEIRTIPKEIVIKI